MKAALSFRKNPQLQSQRRDSSTGECVMRAFGVELQENS